MDNFPSTPPILKVNSSSKKKSVFIVLSVLIVIALIGGASVLIRNYRVRQAPPLAINSNVPKDLPVDNRSLSITGRITDFDGKNLIIKKDNGEEGKIEVASKVNIFKLIDNKYLAASSSSNLRDITTGKDATLTLIEEGGAYKAGTISYIVPINVSLPKVPVSTNSAAGKNP
ncbi:MAG: hypothetical protein ACD_30C00021G0001 [uncultured bacterium]|uniref:DUF5666 domain-containing protein n=3 Tax=Candidatus Daviesiibacteriota TaxID=1752718 RepID=A0A0G0H7A9_9BACT|nr:MAG: hypothetical protein ACD_30C00021G0001 [uncultured bacterium]KKQ07979.1 MAG: hypothetical protein US19_C0034G0015 [Candidatus Daviesbacteria bacterium GW2011_GWB1_36_5]KKQ16163.1 MAG: hypothetical protein US28_C0004G0005 [Candidatus Daviesbacteria bacterium GW2011_GWA1_36_8]OGE33241.1 MAG: hypothetical protein A3C99_01335 [Candidatus Daviesbacteria bacterium RIFCSPHIGHO2_02_FULL_37_9]OGE36142.1 MAG: hypothetical protein A3E66_05025 [Candidatus Daviesbacteria bacterium RIFCSPHIGHO2_12_FU